MVSIPHRTPNRIIKIVNLCVYECWYVCVYSCVRELFIFCEFFPALCLRKQLQEHCESNILDKLVIIAYFPIKNGPLCGKYNFCKFCCIIVARYYFEI